MEPTNASSKAALAAGTGTPKGRWRDDLFSCFRHGPCHPFCCTAYWLTPVALGQLLNRMNLTCLAKPAGSPEEARKSFTYNVYLAVFLVIWTIIVYAFAIAESVSNNDDNGNVMGDSSSSTVQMPRAIVILSRIIQIGTTTYLVYAACTLRRFIRDRDGIPNEGCPDGVVDCCYAYWCLPCLLCQISRHTVNYDEVPAQCCSPTGLPEGYAPGIV